MARRSTGGVVERETNAGTVYALRFRALGRRQYVTLGLSAEGWTRGRAEDELRVVLAEVRRGTWAPPSKQPDPEPDEQKFHEFASRWFFEREHCWRPTTRADYKWRLSDHLLPAFRNRILSDITRQDVDRYAHAKLAGGLSAASVNKTLALLSRILDLALDYGMVDANVAQGRRLPVKSVPRPFLDRPEHIAALLDAAGELDRSGGGRRSGTAYRRALIATLTFAGLRIGEALDLTWADVNLADGRLRVAASKTDAGVRHVNVLPVLRDELAAHRASAGDVGAGDFVFPTTRGGRQSPSNVRNRMLTPAVELAGASIGTPLGKLTPHALRRTFASVLTFLREDPMYVADQLGHRDATTTVRFYSRVMGGVSLADRDRLRDGFRVLVEGSAGAGSGTNGHQAWPTVIPSEWQRAS